MALEFYKSGFLYKIDLKDLERALVVVFITSLNQIEVQMKIDL